MASVVLCNLRCQSLQSSSYPIHATSTPKCQISLSTQPLLLSLVRLCLAKPFRQRSQVLDESPHEVVLLCPSRPTVSVLAVALALARPVSFLNRSPSNRSHRSAISSSRANISSLIPLNLRSISPRKSSSASASFVAASLPLEGEVGAVGDDSGAVFEVVMGRGSCCIVWLSVWTGPL